MNVKATIFIVAFLTMTAAAHDKVTLAISFAGHTQIASDWNSPTGKPDLLERADRYFYEADFGLARINYHNVLKQWIPKDKTIDAQQIENLVSGKSKTENLIAAIDTKDFGPADYSAYGRALNNIALLYHVRGNLPLAETLYGKALRAMAEAYGKTSSWYVASLHNMAQLRKDQGRYDAAEDIFNYVLKYYARTKGKNSREYMIALNNSAMLNAAVGRSSAGMEQLDEVLSMLAGTSLPSGSMDKERIMANRGILAAEADEVEQGTATMKAAIASLEQKEKDHHPDYHEIAIHLASSWLEQQKDNEFLPLLEKSMRKIKQRYGVDNILYANALEIQAAYYLKKADFKSAQTLYTSIVAIRLSSLGDRHREYLDAFSMLGACEWQLGNIESAYAHISQSVNAYLRLLDDFFPSMSQAEQAEFWLSMNPNIELFYSFALAEHKKVAGLLETAYNLRLKTKGMLLNSSSKIRNNVLASKDQALIDKYEQWVFLKNQMASSFKKTNEELAEEDVDLARLEQDINAVEKELSRLTQDFQIETTAENIEWKHIQTRLKGNEAAIEIIRSRNRFSPESQVSYYALCLKSVGSPELVLISKNDEIERRSFKYYRNAIESGVADELSYAVFWKPFAASLSGVNKIYLSSDGVYNSISMNTLLYENGAYLIDKITVVCVPNTRQLVQKPGISRESDKRQDAILFGNPFYGDETILSSLPGTAVETQGIRKILVEKQMAVELFEKDAASEKNLKAVNRPEILHIATHGFFREDVDNGQARSSLSKAMNNPLLRSGLLLSGAAVNLKQISSLTEKEDGIFTAYEAMNLNLSNTKLVVLSACETGSGETVNGEGVYGLSRAFAIAGAHAVILSLWKVDDEATQLLMTTFYERWMESNDLGKSFVEAQKVVRNKYTSPNYWGAFVLTTN